MKKSILMLVVAIAFSFSSQNSVAAKREYLEGMVHATKGCDMQWDRRDGCPTNHKVNEDRSACDVSCDPSTDDLCYEIGYDCSNDTWYIDINYKIDTWNPPSNGDENVYRIRKNPDTGQIEIITLIKQW